MAVEAMHLGAHDFVQKPFHDQELLDRIQVALNSNREQQDEIELKRNVRERYDSLTPREAEVMAAVVKGHANKVIAMDLELSQRTVEITARGSWKRCRFAPSPNWSSCRYCSTRNRVQSIVLTRPLSIVRSASRTRVIRSRSITGLTT